MRTQEQIDEENRRVRRWRDMYRNAIEELNQPVDEEDYIKTIEINNKEIPFNIYKYKDRNSEVVNKFVLYYDKERDLIGIKFIEPNSFRYRYDPTFRPNFLRRKIYYLEILDGEYNDPEGYDVNVKNQYDRTLKSFSYTRIDKENKRNKYVKIEFE